MNRFGCVIQTLRMCWQGISPRRVLSRLSRASFPNPACALRLEANLICTRNKCVRQYVHVMVVVSGEIVRYMFIVVEAMKENDQDTGPMARPDLNGKRRDNVIQGWVLSAHHHTQPDQGTPAPFRWAVDATV
ncbi:MAG: hypothetical protein KGJ79_12805, partial [Alphaproteobacteria bacterium]|nr:hypothetical protein [Alphaproteobacteria bacterium]